MAGLFIILYCVLSLLNINCVNAEIFNVHIATEHHVNAVDSKFLSFTIDPKYLFTDSNHFNSPECLCMALALSPAYIRIAGPSTPHMTFYNTTISIGDLDSSTLDLINFEDLESPDDRHKRRAKKVRDESLLTKDGLTVSHRQWRKFVEWAKAAGFDLVFALNNEERTGSGMWDPNTALNILTVAERAKIGDIFWQLGYECNKQSIEEYLNDLETLRVIVETFPSGREGQWRVVGGDVTNCLQADSKSDFKDYVTLSNDMMDAVLLNGNSSSKELERMSEQDRVRLLHVLSRSTTPLWLAEKSQYHTQLDRAADWLSSLGYSARNGFAVHYRELQHEELHQPSLSFYMALLFKNLVGERVLDVEVEPEQAIIFAHCTSLRQKPVPGAVTLYGANMDDEPARFSLKLSKREEGGDILQFILAFDHSGNIVVNGRAMYQEGDIKPVVKRVRPYKALLINLPPKSFGFWVLANTDVQACQGFDDDEGNQQNEDTELNKETVKVKRSINDDFDDYLDEIVSNDFLDDVTTEINSALNNRITNLNNDLNKFRELVESKLKRVINTKNTREKRQTVDDNKNTNNNKKNKRTGIKNKILKNTFPDNETKSKGLIRNLLKSKRDSIRNSRYGRKHLRLNRNKLNKPNSLHKKAQKTKEDIYRSVVDQEENKKRIRRSVNERHGKDGEKFVKENEIDIDGKDSKLWKILKRINKQLNDLSSEKEEDLQKEEEVESTEPIGDDRSPEATFELRDEDDTGFVKSTIDNLLSVLVELNKNINRVWNALTLLE